MSRHFMSAACALMFFMSSACTEVVLRADGGPGADASADLQDISLIETSSSDPCEPDPCEGLSRTCVDGVCGDCLPGKVEDEEGLCVPLGDPCIPDPCRSVNKACVNGFCGDCLPGYIDDGVGGCLSNTACFPNPCSEPLKTVCTLDTTTGNAKCSCDPFTHDDGTGACTFDPCTPNPCTMEPLVSCVPDGLSHVCTCPQGLVEVSIGSGLPQCAPDPCTPNPCQLYAQTTCTSDLAGEVSCGCDRNFVEADGACVEGQASNGVLAGASQDLVYLDDSMQWLVDDHLIYLRTNTSRRFHPAEARSAGWFAQPTAADVGAGIGRFSAGGTAVHVDAAWRAGLSDDHPLKTKAWWLYYLGYRQLFAFDSQPAWLCVMAADSPDGPWESPQLNPESPGPNCVMKVDGLSLAAITLEPSRMVLSATRTQLGSTPSAGIYAYESSDGLSWSLIGPEAPLMGLATTPTPPALYPRIGARSRLIWDATEQRFVGLLSLPSDAFGDARGFTVGGSTLTSGWTTPPDALTAPAILGPTPAELASGLRYDEMTAWREGALWFGLLQRRQATCPQTGEALVVVSRDGIEWAIVADEVTGNDVFIAPSRFEGQPDASIDTLTGGAPLQADGWWNFYSGGTSHAECAADAAPGGLLHHRVRAGRIAGIGPSIEGAQAVIISVPLHMKEGVTGHTLKLNASVDEKLLIQVESLSPVDSVLDAIEYIVGAGDYDSVAIPFAEALNTYTEGRFRVRFTFLGGGEVFGFSLSDPQCEPNPCTEDPDRTVCDSSGGVALCLCNPPLHDDGVGNCTDDPCLPDPCTAPSEQGCTNVDGEAVCGCIDGWVPSPNGCVPDPCIPVGGVPKCSPPADRCMAVNGEISCYCPEGSVESPSGCLATDLKVFVTSQAIQGSTMGGVAGADNVCNTLASTAGLSGTYLAWLSTVDQAAADRLIGGGPWRTWSEEDALWTALVAFDVDDLRDGELGSAIRYNQLGLADEEDDKCLVWTGTGANGEPPPQGGLTNACAGWTGDGFGQIGRCNGTDESWTSYAPASCAKSQKLYCFQAPGD